MLDLLATHPRLVDGDEVRQWAAKRGVRFGTAFTGLVAAYIAEGTGDTVLAEVALPSSIRSQQNGYVVHPPCWAPASSQ